MKQSDATKLVVITMILAVVAVVVGFAISGVFTTVTEPDDEQTPGGRDYVECGKVATATLRAYDRAANVQSEVEPAYYIFDADGNILVDGSNTTSVSTTTCNALTIYGAGEDAAYYVDKKEVEVDAEVEMVSLDAYKIVTESNLAINMYDDSMNGLNAEMDANKSENIDYEAGDFGPDECNTFNLKLKNNEADSIYRLGAICVGWGGDVNEIVLSTSGWVEGYLPKELNNAVISMESDAGTSVYTGDWKKCYVPSTSKYVEFKEWDSKMFELTVCAGSNEPTENTGDFGAITFLDTAYEKGKDGKMYMDYYVHNDDEKASDVGLAESTISDIGGLTSSVAFELH